MMAVVDNGQVRVTEKAMKHGGACDNTRCISIKGCRDYGGHIQVALNGNTYIIQKAPNQCSVYYSKQPGDKEKEDFARLYDELCKTPGEYCGHVTCRV